MTSIGWRTKIRCAIPVECVIAHSSRDGGANTMCHSVYGLLGAKEWGKWPSSCLHVYLLYDMDTMRGNGEVMITATGLFEFSKLKHQQVKTATFRNGGKKQNTQPQPSLPASLQVPTRDYGNSFIADIFTVCHIWFLGDNPEYSTREDLFLPGNANAVP